VPAQFGSSPSLPFDFASVSPLYWISGDWSIIVGEQSTLTRADLCEAVHEEVGLSRQECSGLVERTLELVVESLERGETVKLSGFGVFQVREKRARMGRNPKTGEPAAINPRRVISFRASQIMKSRVHNAAVES
jgi:integration host factor subunit alpha